MPTDFCPASPKISNIVRHVMYPITICCKDCPALTCFCSVLPVLFSYRSCLSSGTEGSLWGWSWVMMGEETQGGKWRQISVQYWDIDNYMHPRGPCSGLSFGYSKLWRGEGFYPEIVRSFTSCRKPKPRVALASGFLIATSRKKQRSPPTHSHSSAPKPQAITVLKKRTHKSS